MREEIREVEKELMSLSEFFRQNGLDSIPDEDIIYLLKELGIEAEFDNVFCTCDVRDGKVVQTQRTGLGPGLAWKDKEGKKHYICLVCLEGKNKLLDYLSNNKFPSCKSQSSGGGKGKEAKAMKNIKFLRAYDGRYYGWDNSISLYDSNGSKVDGVSVNRDFSSWDILEILADEGYIDVERDDCRSKK